MIKSLLTIGLILLLFPMVSIMIVDNVQGQVDTEIRVAVNLGDKSTVLNFGGAVIKLLDGYSWVVNDTEYNFTTSSFNITMIDNLTADNYDVHHMSGATDEFIWCTINANLRKKLHESISDDGVGYIGECGGVMLALDHYKRQPNNLFEFYSVKLNAFLKDTPIKLVLNKGYLILSKYVEMKYGKYGIIPIPGFRKNWNPGALGISAYGDYGAKIRDYGCNFHLTDLDTTHPILKDYHGETIFTHQGGGAFSQIPCYASVLAYFPEAYELNPNQKLHVWDFKPEYYRFKDLIKEIMAAILDPDVVIPKIKDIYEEWTCWHQN